MRERGENPFANDVAPRLGGRTFDIAEARALAERARRTRPGGTTKRRSARSPATRCSTCAGRVIALRSTGGLSFLRLRDRTGEIQLLVSEAALGATYERLAELDVGDIVEAEGELTASKRGELSIAPRTAAPAHEGAIGRCPRSGTA